MKKKVIKILALVLIISTLFSMNIIYASSSEGNQAICTEEHDHSGEALSTTNFDEETINKIKNLKPGEQLVLEDGSIIEIVISKTRSNFCKGCGGTAYKYRILYHAVINATQDCFYYIDYMSLCTSWCKANYLESRDTYHHKVGDGRYNCPA